MLAPQSHELASLYPGAILASEMRSMRAWLISHPTRRKTARGLAAFVNAWLSREQDRSKGLPDGPGGKFATKGDAEYASRLMARRQQEREGK